MRSLLRSKTMETSRCQVQRYCRGYADTGWWKKNFSRQTIAVLLSLWNLRTSFEIDTSNDTADFPANFCKSCDLLCPRTAAKMIPYKCMVKPYDWSLHFASTCKVNIFTWPHKFNHTYMNTYTVQEPIHSWIPLKEVQIPGRQPGITPKALLRHVNTIAPPKVVCHRKEPLLAPTQVLSVMDLLTCPMCKGKLSQPLKLHCNVVVCAKCIADSIIRWRNVEPMPLQQHSSSEHT